MFVYKKGFDFLIIELLKGFQRAQIIREQINLIFFFQLRILPELYLGWPSRVTDTDTDTTLNFSAVIHGHGHCTAVKTRTRTLHAVSVEVSCINTLTLQCSTFSRILYIMSVIISVARNGKYYIIDIFTGFYVLR